MRIGHYAPHIWARGGIATYVRRLGTEQAQRGHEVWYLSHDREGPAPDRSVVLKTPGDLCSAARALDLDILHLHKRLPSDNRPEGPSIPTVRTMHGNQASCPSGSRFLSNRRTACDRSYSVSGCLWGHLVDGCGSRHPRSLSTAFRRFHQERAQASQTPTMTVSRFVKESMVQSGCDPVQLHVVRSPAPRVETTTQIPDDIVPHMVFLGRIVPQKGLQVLLDALTQVNTPVHLDIAGDGHRLDAMRHHARDIGVGERVTFHGWVEPDEAADLIAAARAVVFPSIWHEPAGLVTLESAAHARPVIASRVGGIPEYAHPDFALRVEPGDAAALARSVNRLATDLSLARTMGAAGRRHAQTTFAMNPYLDRIDTIYEEVLHPTSLPATTI